MTSVIASKTHQIINSYSDKTEDNVEKTSQLFWKLRNQAKIDKHCKSRINDTNNENGPNAKCFQDGKIIFISNRI